MDLRRHLLLPLAAVAVSAGLGACGSKGENEGKSVVRAETEGIYLDIGELKYQVQVSRQLNPADIEDKAYLEGLAPDQVELKPNELWFGVFIRVQNDEADHPVELSNDIEITDTVEKIYKPIPLDDTNQFAYRSDEALTPGAVLPERDSVAGEAATQGALLLFKVTNETLDNRPLELKIEGREVPQQTGIINIDV